MAGWPASMLQKQSWPNWIGAYVANTKQELKIETKLNENITGEHWSESKIHFDDSKTN